jgi:phosphatidylglycerol:prolipoprotein diacylglycerol transferase
MSLDSSQYKLYAYVVNLRCKYRSKDDVRVVIFYGIDPVLVEIGQIRLWYYGLVYAIGLLAVSFWVWLKRERLGFDGRDVAEFPLLFAAGVLLGGRIFDVALYEWFYYRDHVWQIPSLWHGGIATHGVLLGAVIGTLVFCRLRSKTLFEIADELVIPGAVLMALGRIGNHINGEVYGSVTDVAWAMEFPYAEGCRHPVALYDAAKNLLLVPLLLGVRSVNLGRHGYLPRGLLLGHFVLWYGLLRLFVDYFREYDSYWFGIGRGQYFNLFMAVVGLCIIVAVRKQASPEGSVARQSTQVKDPTLWLKNATFYALVALCLSIPSGWTQQVLEGFEVRKEVAPSVETRCGSPRIVSLVDTRLLLLALYSGLDAAGVGQGHMVELIEASSVVLYGQGAVHPALDADARDVFEAYGFDVLSLPSAA